MQASEAAKACGGELEQQAGARIRDLQQQLEGLQQHSDLQLSELDTAHQERDKFAAALQVKFDCCSNKGQLGLQLPAVVTARDAKLAMIAAQTEHRKQNIGKVV